MFRPAFNAFERYSDLARTQPNTLTTATLEDPATICLSLIFHASNLLNVKVA